jgi:RNA-directed DNA polymerase
MDVQRWILRRILDACTPNGASYAYQQGRSIVDCASRHTGARWLVKLDIHDFFGSIGERPVFDVFAGLGYPKLVGLELSRLCTRAYGPIPQPRRISEFHGKAPYDVYARGYLPQGAPTSGALANLVMTDVDRDLTTFADNHGLVFTRYSDDMVFSSTERFSRELALAIIREATRRLDRSGLRIHRKKTRVVTPGARKVVLGLLVDGSRPRLLPEFKRRVEVHVRGVERFGLSQHADHRHFDSILAMINHVDGCIAFAAGVEGDYAAELGRKWARALASRGYPRAQIRD